MEALRPQARLTHLDRLEAESIFILRETVAEAVKPVMLYSMGKDSAVMLHLAKKAFFPGPLPFALLHVDPKRQRPELWSLYNVRKNKGESMRVFPLSNWTELDVWQYILREAIEVVPLYFAAERPTVERDGLLLMADDDRMRLEPGEKVVS